MSYLSIPEKASIEKMIDGSWSWACQIKYLKKGSKTTLPKFYAMVAQITIRGMVNPNPYLFLSIQVESSYFFINLARVHIFQRIYGIGMEYKVAFIF